MKRRSFGYIAASSLTGLSSLGFADAVAQSAILQQDPALLKTTLTPLGGERAGNADGSIPAWTGGYTTLPDGLKPGGYVPELFPDEQPLLVIDASNMSEHADRLNEGVMTMMTKYGFHIKVYPTHRTAAAPQWMYDAAAANVGRAQLNPAGGRLGFTGAFGALPFPIPDMTDPYKAGAQIVWNHCSSWKGAAYLIVNSSYSVSDRQFVLASTFASKFHWDYYLTKSIDSFNGYFNHYLVNYLAPPNTVGQELLLWVNTQPYLHPQAAWELLNGEGRVRRAPEISFDTPSTNANGICNYDEYFGFNGSLEKYDWKCLGKKEMYVPYNNNRLYAGPAQPAHLAHFIDPDLVRFELHRCWVVEATLHPGERNVLARRMFYVDEDTCQIALNDVWDANGNLYRTGTLFNNVRPELPGTIYGNLAIYNLQTDDYVSVNGMWDQASNPNGLVVVDDWPPDIYDPNNLAADGQY